ncbi:peptidylprolyl isomerase [Brevundimonas sp.]|uniref:peptidylprolyl isomerase n=1 Tax=Brevundimonas sp. TaxID=1871086 RepID=UPI0025BF0780|nr:peptidylprolyl isomerase [Brevundimonas sp.]
MGLMRYSTGAALAALLLAGSAYGQTAQAQAQAQAPARPAAQPSAQGPAAAGAPNPAAGDTPTRPAAAQPQFQLADGIVATVNDKIITGFDLRQRMLMLIASSQIQPTEENLPAIQQAALNALIEDRLKNQELAKFASQLKVTDEEVNEEIGEMARQAGATPQAYLEFLQQGGIRPETFRENLRTEIGWSRLTGGRFGSRARPSPLQVDQELRRLNAAAAQPQYLIGEIYIDAARVGGQQAALNGARQLVQQIIQGAPFQAVAQQFSSAPSASARVPGDAGWVVKGTVQPALQAIFDQLQPGQLSNPVAVDGGVYIIYMRDKRDGAATSLVSMKQAMVELPETASEAEVAAATAKLESLRQGLTCDNIMSQARATTGVTYADLGESDVQNLAPQFQQFARTGEVGAVSSPIRTPLGLHLVAVCGRRVGGPDVPTRQQVENRLRAQNLQVLDRRYLRDLRNDALIEVK